MSLVLLCAALGSSLLTTEMTPLCWRVGYGRNLLLRKKKKFEWYSWCVTKYDLFTSSLPFSPPDLYHPITDLRFHNPRCILKVL
ncbi:hypothetical protein Pcinc_018333 [Petrolisthes cinctipes]|uniref:Secreted protein n=1 Tax=Petrolisthes cinctipes TaxID=88211 RepID=A0AAE1FMD7_PETCI|nr:hypothetical protein Pcinc_018333 [Petrolisthes cinctipes]